MSRRDDYAPARGIVFAVVFALPLWGIAVLVHVILEST